MNKLIKTQFKIILMLLSLVFILSCLFSCGGEKDDNTDDTISVTLKDGGESTNVEFTSPIGNTVTPITKNGHTFYGYFSDQGQMYFDAEDFKLLYHN